MGQLIFDMNKYRGALKRVYKGQLMLQMASEEEEIGH